MKNLAFTSKGENSSFLFHEKRSYLQNFQAFAESALTDERLTCIVDFLDCLNQKASEIVSEAGKHGFADIDELQMEIFDLARQYAGQYRFD
jgi:hypothetical protein